MIFGFTMAIVTGFLLTAVPGWTQTNRVHGTPLLLLVVLWGLGRIAMLSNGFLPLPLVALVDLPYLPVLLYVIGPAIFKAGNRRNFGFPILLLLLWIGNLLSHLLFLGVPIGSPRLGFVIAVDCILILVAVVGGRVVPVFTRNSFRMAGLPYEVKIMPKTAQAAVAAMLLTFFLELILITPLGSFNSTLEIVVGTSALLTTILLLVRAHGWQVQHALDNPIVLILHVGQAWLIIGFLAMAVAYLTHAIPSTIALHAFTAGAIGTMTLAFMTRAALGHTGHAIKTTRLMNTAYLLVIGGGLIRVFGPTLLPQFYSFWMILAGLHWSAGFALYTILFFPILTQPSIVDPAP
jgi:uncharacterized protein involved in response to NO